MVCEQCQQRTAIVHLTRIINGEKTEMHLCELCATESGQMMEPTFSIHSLLGGLLDIEEGVSRKKESRCGQCGQTYKDFAENGLFGCSSCYETFSSQIPSLLRRVQGTTEHRGKVPVRIEGRLKARRQIEGLRKELEEAVSQEEYELAAKLRDQLRALENKGDR